MVADLYRKYFKHQTVNHPDLLHADTSGAQVFAVIPTEEFVGDFRANAQTKGYIFRLLEYSYQVGDDNTPRTQKRIQGGFIVAHHYSQRDGGTDAYHLAMDRSEQVIDEMIEKIVSDSRAGHPLFGYSISAGQDFQVTPTRMTGDMSYAGYMVLFTFAPDFRICITDPAAPAWVDGGETPFEL